MIRTKQKYRQCRSSGDKNKNHKFSLLRILRLKINFKNLFLCLKQMYSPFNNMLKHNHIMQLKMNVKQKLPPNKIYYAIDFIGDFNEALSR
ncbi:hypothetical protein VK87_0219245 [Escherichia fergusonii]|nr:hypothetical protein VK87_0219245 [Escherichia fergusonii]